MTLDRQHGRLVMSCDGCDDEVEGDGAEDACPAFFDAFIDARKAEGWLFEKLANGEWEHYCPKCSGGGR